MREACRKLRLLGWLVLGLAVLLNAGCLVAAIGAGAAGAAAAGYLYCNGLLYRDYPATLTDTAAAVRTSLLELQFPIVKEKSDTGTLAVQTRTGDGHTVRIYLDVVSSPIPSEGALTRIGIRVGFTGDEAVSARILDQVSRHLVARPLVPGAPPPIASAPGAPPPVANSPGSPAAGAPNLLPPRPVADTPAPPLAGR